MQSLKEFEVPIEIKKDIEIIVDALLEKYIFNIDKIVLFGSYATNQYQPDSDIDIMVSLNELPDIKQRHLYKHAVDIDRDLDLLFCSKEQLASNVFVYKRIHEQGVVLYEKL